MTAGDLNRQLRDDPFQPFRVHLSSGRTIDVRNPGIVVGGESSAIFPLSLGKDREGYPIIRDWRTVAHSYIVEFADLDQQPPATKRPIKKRKS